jgi:hypothetical protein
VKILVRYGLLDRFSDIPKGIQEGFDMGVTAQLHSTYTPPNHRSAMDNTDAIDCYISKEVSAHRYSGPFTRERLEQLIGPFRTSPLGTVPKAGTDELRMIQDFLFPRDDIHHDSVNSEIDSDAFPCEWGTFSEMALLVMDAPSGAQVATLDVDAALHCVPIRPDQQRHFIVHWQEQFWIDACAPFGPASSPGVWGRIADCMSAIYLATGVVALKKWVDDFAFFRYPCTRKEGGVRFNYDLQDIYNVAEQLGWPWKPSKTKDFAPSFRYLGFVWDLTTKIVAIPEDKRERYIKKLSPWVAGSKFTRTESEQVHGTLVHCSLAIPSGRSHLVALSRFTSSFDHTHSKFARHTPGALVLSDIEFWRQLLIGGECSSVLSRPPALAECKCWVDASTSYGVGVVIDGEWDSWRLCKGWNINNRRIGWAEMVAIEFGLRMAVAHGYRDASIWVWSDNKGVIGALEGGKSRNLEHNRVLQRIVSLMRATNIHVQPTYVPTTENKADNPSRGTPALGLPRTPERFRIPQCLATIITRPDRL